MKIHQSNPSGIVIIEILISPFSLSAIKLCLASMLLFGSILTSIDAQISAQVSNARFRSVDDIKTKRLETISNELEKIRDRITLPVSRLEEIRTHLQKIADNKGQNDTGYIFRTGEDTDAILNDIMFQGTPSALDVLVEFNNELQERGIDLIVVPVPNSIQVYISRLYPDMARYSEIWPSYNDGLAQLLENEVEIIDLRDDFSSLPSESVFEGALFPYDHHMNSPGMRILAEAVFERIQRYPWAQDLAVNPDRYIKYNVDVASELYLAKIFLGKGEHLPWGEDWVPPEKQTMRQFEDTFGISEIKSIDPILIIGDSLSYFHASYPIGRGLPNHISYLLGFPVPFAGQAAGSNTSVYNYSRWFSFVEPQPNVIILVIRAASLTRNNWIRSALPPQGSDVDIKKTGSRQLSKSKVTGEMQIVSAQLPVNEQIQVFGHVLAVSSLPDPETAVYGDALIVNDVEVLIGNVETPIHTIQWIMRNYILQPAADIKEGKFYWFELMPWTSIGRGGEALRSIMQINDTINYDVQDYWVLNTTNSILEPIAPEYLSHIDNPHLRNLSKLSGVNSGVLFIGDYSVMPFSEDDLKPYLPENAVAVLNGKADTIENILWRAFSGELDGFNPTIVAISLMPSSYRFYSNAEITYGLKLISMIIRWKMPDSIIAFIGMLPEPDRIAEINSINWSTRNYLNSDNFVYININSILSVYGFPENPLFLENGNLDPKAKKLWIDLVVSKLHHILN